jgi:transposase
MQCYRKKPEEMEVNFMTISLIMNRFNFSTFVTLPRWNIRKCLQSIKMKYQKNNPNRLNNSEI